MATLAEIMNKRPAGKIEKLYPGVTQKQLGDLTVRDLNNIAAHLMVEDGRSMTGILNPMVISLEIITDWASDKKVGII